MTDLRIKDLVIYLPESFNGIVDDAQIAEWIEWELGQNNSIDKTNPLIDIVLSECEISVGDVFINGKQIKI